MLKVLLISNWYHWRIHALKRIAVSGHQPIGIVIYPSREWTQALPKLVRGLLAYSNKARSLATSFLSPESLEQIKLAHSASRLGASVLEVADINRHDARSHIRQLAPDVILTFAWPRKFGAELLAIPALGCINCHPSLLPRHRGLHPISAAILANDNETGVTFHLMSEVYDSGDMLLQKTTPIAPDETGLSLLNKCGKLATDALPELLDGLASGSLQPIPQDDSLATETPKLAANDAVVNWTLPAAEIERQTRALYPWFVRRTYHDNEAITFRKCEVAENSISAVPGQILGSSACHLAIATGNDAIIITEPQIDGLTKRQSRRYLRNHVKVGKILQER